MVKRKSAKKRLWPSAKRYKTGFKKNNYTKTGMEDDKENYDGSYESENFIEDNGSYEQENYRKDDGSYNIGDDNISVESFDDESDYEQYYNEEYIEEDEEENQLEGRRLTDIHYYTQSLQNFPHEYDSCTSKYLVFVKEIRDGFKSKYLYKCKLCCNEKYIYSEDPDVTLDVNTACVEGIICTGNGESQLEEFCASLNMPCVSSNKFQKLQNHLFSEMEELAYEQMIEAGKEEKRLALLENDVDDDGIPHVIVVADLAASPDGLIGSEGLVEVKCPFSASHLAPKDAVHQGLITFCKCTESGEMCLKRNHNYFFQVQGQLHVTRREYCYFIVWTPYGLMHEKIVRCDNFWKEKMQTQLKDFYVQCILPELIDPRIPRNLSVRERHDS